MKKNLPISLLALASIGLISASVGCGSATVAVDPPPPVTATVEVAATTPPPPAPPKHPFYLHALSDLRFARALLEKKGGDTEMKWDEHDAIVEIDLAIKQIKAASIEDGKDLTDHPAIDAKLVRAGRLHAALDALNAAHKDVDQDEDNAFAEGLHAKAIHDIETAIKFAQLGIAAAEKAGK